MKTTLGRRIRRWRRRRGWTQAELAARVPMHRVTLANVERDAKGLNLRTAVRLARALGVELGVLVGE